MHFNKFHSSGSSLRCRFLLFTFSTSQEGEADPLLWLHFWLFFFTDAKRLIGRRFDDGVVQSDMKHWPFTVINDSTRPKVQVEYKGETKSFYPEEISSMVLTKMKEIAEAYLGKVRLNFYFVYIFPDFIN